MTPHLTILVVLTLWAIPTSAATLWVSSSGSGSSCTQSLPCAFTNGLQQLSGGDTLMATAGTYQVDGEPQISASGSSGAPTTIRVADGATVVLQASLGIAAKEYVTITGEHGTLVFDGQHTRNQALGFSSDGQHHHVLKNFEVRNYYEQVILGDLADGQFLNLHIHHIGLHPDGSVTCFLWGVHDDAYKCHAIYTGGANTVMDGLNIHDIEGMGLHFHTDRSSDNLIIRNSRFRICGGNCIGFFVTSRNVLVYNNVLSTNRAGSAFPGSGNMLEGKASGKFYNNTLVGAFQSGFRIAGDAEVRNNISMNHGEANFSVVGGSPTFSNNLCSSAGEGCARVASLGETFVGAGSGDWHLAAGSPAIDQGMLVAEVTTDIDRAPRPQGAGMDIGAYEAGGRGPVPPAPPPKPILDPPRNVRLVGP